MCMYTPANIQHWSSMMLPSSNLGHTSLPPSLLLESCERFGWWNASELNGSRGICLRCYPKGCFLTFLQPRVDKGHDLEAFRKKMRVKCHIGHTGWLYGITCLAHLIDVAYDFPVNWSQNPTCKLSSTETHKSSCAWVDCNLSSIRVAFTNQTVVFTLANSHGETDWKLPVQGATKYHGDSLWIKFGNKKMPCTALGNS